MRGDGCRISRALFAREVGILNLNLILTAEFYSDQPFRSPKQPLSFRRVAQRQRRNPLSRPSSQLSVSARFASTPWKTGASAPVPIFRNLPIHRRRHIFPRSQIPKLHHPMPLPRQLPPPARLLRILFNPLILHSLHLKPHRPKLPRTSPRNAKDFPVNSDLARSHHLLCHRTQNLSIHSFILIPCHRAKML